MRMVFASSCCLLICLLAREVSAAPPLLPADIPNPPQKSVLVRPQPTPASAAVAPVPAPTLAPVPQTTGVPQLAPRELPSPEEPPKQLPAAKAADWQRVKGVEAEETGEVVPATATSDVLDVEPQVLPETPLIQQFLQQPLSAENNQTTVDLHRLLARANDSSLRLRVVKAYWQWTFCCSQQRLYEQQMARLQSIDLGDTGVSGYESAKALLKIRQQQNELDLIEARHELSTLTLVSIGELTWPGDFPVVGRFRTEYELLFQNRQAPPALEKINLALPKIWQLLAAQSAAVEVLHKSLEESEAAYEAGEITMSALLASYRQLEQVEQQYLLTVKRYNVEIAEYVIAVTGQTSSRERLVGMLIKPKRAMQSVLVPKR